MRHLPALKETPCIKNCTTFYLRNLLKKYVSSGFEYVGMEHWYFQCPYRYALNERERPLDTYFFNKLLENKKPARFLLHQHLLIHQPNQKPEWGVVKADDSFIICFGFTIIPRAAAAFFQEGAGAVFGEENTGGVDGSAHEDMPALHFFAEGRKNGRHAINGEHPDGRLAGHFFVFFSAQRATSGP